MLDLLRKKIFNLPLNRSGASAVEFAIVGPLLMTLIFAALEIGWVMTKIALVDNAVAQAATFIYTGAASNGAVTQSDISNFICDKSIIIDDCENNIAVEATVVSDFASLPTWRAPCYDSQNARLNPTVAYSTGAGNEIVYLRVCITTDIFLPGVGFGLSLVDTATNRTQIVSSIAIVNEPF